MIVGRFNAGVVLVSIKLWFFCPEGRIALKICDNDSSVEIDQVLKDQFTPAISAGLHKQSTFRKPAKFDR